MKIRLARTLAVTLCFAILGIFTFTALAQEAPKITKEEVLGMLGNPDVIIIDVRSDGDWRLEWMGWGEISSGE